MRLAGQRGDLKPFLGNVLRNRLDDGVELVEIVDAYAVADDPRWSSRVAACCGCELTCIHCMYNMRD